MIVSDLGAHWDELADAYHGFDDAHWQVDFASPRGHPRIDQMTLRVSPVLHLLGFATLRSRLPRTEFFGRPVVEKFMRAKKLSQVRVTDYDVVYIVGGYGGELPDLSRDPQVARVLKEGMRHQRWFAGRLNVVDPHRVLDRSVTTAGQLGQIVVGERLVSCRLPKRARRVAWRVVSRLSDEADHQEHHRQEELQGRKTRRI